MKVVIDTNVWLSALTSSQGASHRLVQWLFEQDAHLHCVSIPFVLELEDVFFRPSNQARLTHFSKDQLHQFVNDICHVSLHQSIYFLWRPLIKDPKDDMVLELVVNAQADFLVTYNLKDFKQAEKNFDFRLLTPKQFLELKGVIG